MLQYKLRDHFHFLESVREGGTVAFRVKSAISHDKARASSELANSSDEEVDNSFLYSMGLLPPGETHNVAAAHVMHFHHLGATSRRFSRLAKYCAVGLNLHGEFPGMIRQYFPNAQHTKLVA